jgi:hypothetical protein
MNLVGERELPLLNAWLADLTNLLGAQTQ